MYCNKKSIFMLLATLAVFCIADSARAAVVTLSADRSSIKVGESFKVDVLLNTENESINTLSGTITFPATVVLNDIQSGNSLVSLWVEKPGQVSPGTATFAGIIPGGFKGESGFIFSLIFRGQSFGPAAIALRQGQALLNDGQGTAVRTTMTPAKIIVVPGVAERINEYELTDITPPEAFTPYLMRDPAISDDQWLVAFTTQDKGSGVDYYEVQENNNQEPTVGNWKRAESPVLLQDQKLHSFIHVRAVDKKGNVEMSVLSPTTPAVSPYEKYFIWCILGAGLILIIRYLWKRRRHN